MGKFEDLERLQKLKESGTISEEEFETEKKRILNNCSNQTNILNENKEIVKKEKLEKETANKKSIKRTIITFTIAISLILIFPLIIITIQKSKEVTVPNLIGKTLSEAKEELSNLELNLKAKYPSLYSDEPEAIIQSQDNKEGSVLKKGDTVEVTAKTQEQLDKEKQEEEERKKQEEEAKAKGYRSSPATDSTIVSCAKTLIDKELRSSTTARWGDCEKIDEDNYGRCLVYVSLEAQNGFGAYSKLNYFVVLQYVEYDGHFTYKPYIYKHELTTFGSPVYDYYVTEYKKGNIYPVIQTFLDSNGWNTRPSE